MMEVKVFVLCFGLLAVLCTCEARSKGFVSKYNVKISGKDGHKYNEAIEVDTEKKTETFHVPKTSSDNEETDVIYDFKKNQTMLRVPSEKACFLYNSTGNIPEPEELLQILDKGDQDGDDNSDDHDDVSSNEVDFDIVGSVDDRSALSDEMKDLCANLPIHYVAKATEVDNTETELED